MSTEDRHNEFLRLFLTEQPRIYGYIRTLTPNRADAEELLQETASVLWRRFDEFEPGTHFDRWAYRIAYHQVLYHRQKSRRAARVFSPELLDQLARTAQGENERLGAVGEALEHCLAKLAGPHRDLIRRRFEPGASNRIVARAIRRSESAVSRALARIYQVLLRCIRQEIGDVAEERP